MEAGATAMAQKSATSSAPSIGAIPVGGGAGPLPHPAGTHKGEAVGMFQEL